jgi:hypothetical protein
VAEDGSGKTETSASVVELEQSRNFEDGRIFEEKLENNLVSMLKYFFPSLPMTRPNKLECLYLAITFQSSLTFAGNTRSLPKKEASERCSN